MHEVLVNRLGGLSLPRKSVVRLIDRPDMTLDVYRGHKTTMQQQQSNECLYSVCLSMRSTLVQPYLFSSVNLSQKLLKVAKPKFRFLSEVCRKLQQFFHFQVNIRGSGSSVG